MPDKEHFECVKCGDQSAYIYEVRDYTLKTYCPTCGKFRTFLKPGPPVVEEYLLPEVSEEVKKFFSGWSLPVAEEEDDRISFEPIDGSRWVVGKDPVMKIGNVMFRCTRGGGYKIYPKSLLGWHLDFSESQVMELVEFWRSCGAGV